MKKLLASVIVLMLLVSCCLIAAMPTSAADVNYDEWEIYDGVVVEYTGDATEIIVPSLDKDGNAVEIIDYRAFFMMDTLKAAYICEGIITMRDEAFYKCIALNEVSLPYSLEDLSNCNMFKHTSIHSIVVPGNVVSIPNTFILGSSSAGTETGGVTDFVISYGVQKAQHGSIFFEANELIFPSTVDYIAGAMWQYPNRNVDVYICNPNCELGTLKADWNGFLPGGPDNKGAGHVYKKEEGAPIVVTYGNTDAVVTLHVPQSGVKNAEDAIAKWTANVKKMYETAKLQWPGDDYKLNYKVVAMTDAEVAEKDQWTKDNGTVSPTKYQMKEPGVLYIDETATDPNNRDTSGTNSNSGNNGNNGNNKGNKGNNSNNVIYQNGGFDIDLTPIIIGAAIFLFIIVAAIVVLIIVLSSKKKKKKKKKVAAEPVEAEPVIEEAAEEAETVDEVPAEDPADE